MAQESKDCFGDPECFDANDAECAGGQDPAFTNPRTGLHIHDRCAVFEQCRRISQAKKTSLAARSPQFVTPKTHPPTQWRPQQPQPSAQPVRVGSQPYSVPAPQQQRPVYPTQQNVQQQAQVPQQAVPAVYHPLQVLFPQESAPFLTVQEPNDQSIPLWQRLLAGAGRAAFKGMFSHGAYVVDHLPVFYPNNKKEET